MNPVAYSSKRHDWETPQALFDAINAEFNFTLDACALPHNAKCEQFFTPDDNALEQHWSGVVWMNPPYGHQIGQWIQKAWQESRVYTTVVCLIPAYAEIRTE